MQWGLDFISLLSPPSSMGHRYILTAYNYCTRWTKYFSCRKCTTDIVANFLKKFIINHFGCPYALVCDNGSAFTSLKFTSWAFDYGIYLKFSSNYYHQGNGLEESTNKNLITIIKELLNKNPKDWHTQLHFSLWVDCTCYKDPLGDSPFNLVYGLACVPDLAKNPHPPIH